MTRSACPFLWVHLWIPGSSWLCLRWFSCTFQFELGCPIELEAWHTSCSSEQSSFSSSSCQFQSISTFFLCEVITSFWILLALSFLFLSSFSLRLFSVSSMSFLIPVIVLSDCKRIWTRRPASKRATRLTSGQVDFGVAIGGHFHSFVLSEFFEVRFFNFHINRLQL